MSDLAGRLGVAVPSVSSLELNDERGTAKSATVDRALVALDLVRWDVVLPADEFKSILAGAQKIADEVAWTMALEAQTLSDEAISGMVQKLVMQAIARR